MKTNQEKVKKIQSQIGHCQLVAATKYINSEELENLSKAGVTVFGENRVQSFLEKYHKNPDIATWHFIGNLQTNKVKDIIGKVDLIHSVSNYRLIDEIQKQAQKKNIVVNILIEVNIANEQTKQGFKKEEITQVFTYLQSCPHIQVKGLMMMAPHIEPEATRKYFYETKQLFEKLKKQFPEFELTDLSMGMSNDYIIAIEEGATMVRIGSALFDE